MSMTAAEAQALYPNCRIEPLGWLNKQFEDTFFCIVGPPKAYFEIPLPPEFVRRLDGPVAMMVQYQTFKFAVQSDTPENRVNLASEFWDVPVRPVVDNIQRAGRDPRDFVLFWRTKPQFAPGDHGSLTLRARFAVPGLTFPGGFYGV